MIGDPDNPANLHPSLGAYRKTAMDDLMKRVDEELPEGVDWHSERAVEAVLEMALNDDPKSGEYDPPQLHSPNGTFADLIECFNGIPVYDPEKISAPTMLIRGSHDLTSTRTDAFGLFDLLGSDEKRYVEIANGGHFVSLARNCGQLYDEVNGFFTAHIC